MVKVLIINSKWNIGKEIKNWEDEENTSLKDNDSRTVNIFDVRVELSKDSKHEDHVITIMYNLLNEDEEDC